MPAAHGTDIGDGKGSALHLLKGGLALPGPLDHVVELNGQIRDTLAIHISDDRNNQTSVRIYGHPDVVVVLHDKLSGARIQCRIEVGKGLEGCGHGLEREYRDGQFAPFGLDGGLVFFPKGIQSGNVRLGVAGHMGYLRPGQGHLSGRGPSNGTDGYPFNGSPF